MVSKETKATHLGKHAFGTFGGVFTPSILTILGVIMFLRTGYVVGYAGVQGALLVLLLAEIIVILTSFSIAAISTNTPVSGGGAYFLISRVMGPEFGGAIGLALYFAQALSIPFYVLGFTEALTTSFPAAQDSFALIALGTIAVLFVITYAGAGSAIRAQYIVLAVLALSVVAFLGGGLQRFDANVLAENWAPRFEGSDVSFWIVFAIYFPAVTGIMTGINMSGDLKTPGRSIVRGTFGAVAVGFLIYAAQIIISGGSQSREALVQRPFETLVEHALWGTGYLVIAGVFAATISSALASMLTAPRVLQAIGRDRVMKILQPLSRGSKKGDEPIRALWFTLMLSVAVVAVAVKSESDQAFNIVAQIVAMFFLCTYGVVNVAAFVEAFGSNPSFRPRFRFFHWGTALVGGLGCVGAMFLISPQAALLATAFLTGLYVHLSRKIVTATYGDARRGFVYSALRKNLLQLSNLRQHAKNWRPTVLVLSGNPETRLGLVLYGVWLEAGRGIVTIAEIVTGDLKELALRRDAAQERLESFVQKNNLQVVPEVIVARNFDEGLMVLLQAHSIGPIKPNVVVMGWPKERGRLTPFANHLQEAHLLGKSIVLILDRGKPERPHRIDIWWRGRENGSLMLILAHLLIQNWEWRTAKIRILREISDETGRGPAHEALTEMVEAARISAIAEIVISDKPFEEVLGAYSKDASLVFLGFQPPEEQDADFFYDNYEKLLRDMPTTILVNSSGEADLLA